MKTKFRMNSQANPRAPSNNRARNFQTSGKRSSLESRKRIEKENVRIAEKLYSIQHGFSLSKADLVASESKRKLQAKHLINKKRLEYDNLNKDNLRMHDRLTNQ